MIVSYLYTEQACGYSILCKITGLCMYSFVRNEDFMTVMTRLHVYVYEVNQKKTNKG